MHNRKIAEVPVALFLGAGATKPLGKLLMGEFITELLRDKVFGSEPLFQRIIYGHSDLEYLFQELEDWTEKAYIQRNPGGQAYFTDFPKKAQELLYALRKKVFEAYQDIEDPAKVGPLLTPLFDGIFSQLNAQKYPLVVFTTNYDPAVEMYCEWSSSTYEVQDGFSYDQPGGAVFWQRKNFDSFPPQGKKKTIVLFKLHGSARWVRKGDQVTKLPFPVYAEAADKYQNVVIYPATRKVALDDPFFTAYDYFQRTMDACGCCVVIGYSFRDYEALTKLASASIHNPRLKVLVVDPRAEALCKDLSAKGIRCTPAPQLFGKDVEYLHTVSVLITEALKNLPSGKITITG